jgi:uncharacterized membrane protein
MTLLVAAVAALALSHLGPMVPGVRGALIARLGRTIYLGAHSLLSLATLALVIWAYRAAPAEVWYVPPIWLRGVAVALMPVACLLLIGRLTTPPRNAGIYRISAAPGSAGLLLWALLHLVNMAVGRNIVVFAGLAAVAASALLKNRQKARAAGIEASWLPFLSALRGGIRINWAEIGGRRIALALALYAVLLALHPIAIGVDPLAALRSAITADVPSGSVTTATASATVRSSLAMS